MFWDARALSFFNETSLALPFDSWFSKINVYKFVFH